MPVVQISGIQNGGDPSTGMGVRILHFSTAKFFQDSRKTQQNGASMICLWECFAEPNDPAAQGRCADTVTTQEEAKG
jgi:hypothetical protein